jgi:hypothetical protein
MARSTRASWSSGCQALFSRRSAQVQGYSFHSQMVRIFFWGCLHFLRDMNYDDRYCVWHEGCMGEEGTMRDECWCQWSSSLIEGCQNGWWMSGWRRWSKGRDIWGLKPEGQQVGMNEISARGSSYLWWVARCPDSLQPVTHWSQSIRKNLYS